jgi:RNA polymerase sigma factor (sigma-70 family)
MPDTSDMELLRDYHRQGSEEAFAELARRHVNLVYSVALRHTGIAAHAEEITQAVFVILARKAGNLRSDTILEGWLHETTRLTALSFLRGERRRQFREQEAYMQSTLQESADVSVWNQLAPLLDEAVSRLGKKDRDAVMLRFFKDQSVREVAAALKVNEAAAQRRVHRAVEKLRHFFSKRGVALSSVALTGAISTHSIQTAPALLAKSAAAVALAKGAATSISTITLAKATLIAMKTKTIVTTTAAVAASAMILGTGTFLVYHLATAQAPSTPAAPIKFTDSVPVKFDNTSFRPDGDRDGTFVVEIDPDTLHTSNSVPAIHIKGPVAADSSGAAQNPVAANGAYKKTDNSSSSRYFVTSSSVLYGKHIRVTGWLKTRDVGGWASAFVIILGIDGRHLQYDDMSDRPIRGTTGWQQVEFVTDLPNEACIIYFGPDLYGPGELWGDDFQITLAPRDEPSTDDRNWRIASESDPTVYSEATDFNVTHNGHPTICLTYTPDGTAPRGTHIRLAHDFYGPDSDKYCGHTVRMTGWIKTENVSERIEPVIFPYAGWNKLLAKDSMARDYSLKGTRDWTRFSVTCVVSEDAGYLDTGFNFFGSGKAWIDTGSIKLEIVK